MSDEPPRRRGIIRKKFDGFWDYDAVNVLFLREPARCEKMKCRPSSSRTRGNCHQMVTHEPNKWRMPSNIVADGYAEIWADEILPIAREVHARVEFSGIVHAAAERTTASLLRVKQSKNQPAIMGLTAFGQLT